MTSEAHQGSTSSSSSSSSSSRRRLYKDLYFLLSSTAKQYIILTIIAIWMQILCGCSRRFFCLSVSVENLSAERQTLYEKGLNERIAHKNQFVSTLPD